MLSILITICLRAVIHFILSSDSEFTKEWEVLVPQNFQDLEYV